jgi:hypothetical protein
MALPSVPRELSNQKGTLSVRAAQAAPADAGDSRRCHGFCILSYPPTAQMLNLSDD